MYFTSSGAEKFSQSSDNPAPDASPEGSEPSASRVLSGEGSCNGYNVLYPASPKGGEPSVSRIPSYEGSWAGYSVSHPAIRIVVWENK